MNETEFVEEIYTKLSATLPNSIFGITHIFIHEENFKGKLPKSMHIEKNNFNPATDEDGNGDEKYKFFLSINFDLSIKGYKHYQNSAITFEFCNSEAWISTWFHGPGNDNIDNHPFVLSWFRFLEKNEYSKDTVGLDGSCNYEIIHLEEGIELLKKWIDWISYYSN